MNLNTGGSDGPALESDSLAVILEDDNINRPHFSMVSSFSKLYKFKNA
jgi:hypothetical protein